VTWAFAVGLGLVALGIAHATRAKAILRPLPVVLIVNGLSLSIAASGVIAMRSVDALAVLLLILALFAFLGGALLVRLFLPRRAQRESRPPRPPSDSLWYARLAGLCLTGLVAYGLFSFRESISSLAQVSFSELTAQQIRYFQVYEATQVGRASSLMGLAGLASFVNLLAFRLLLPRLVMFLLPILLTMGTPSRTTTLNAVVVAGVAAITSGRIQLLGSAKWSVARRRFAVAVGVGLALLFGYTYFVSLGNSLGKSGDGSLTGLTPGLENALIYFSGSWSALSEVTAVGAQYAPQVDGYRVFWGLSEVGQLLGLLPDRVPLLGAGVPIPFTYNTYTAVGDTYLAGGLAGLLLGWVVFGGLSGLVTVRLRSDRLLPVVWLNAVLVGIAASSFSGLRLFVFDTVALSLLGMALLAWMSRERKPATSSSARATEEAHRAFRRGRDRRWERV
jgi:oligosaccharide repeat unit polymerase